MYYGGSVTIGDLWWFIRFEVICAGLWWWFMLVYGGSWWFVVVLW